MLEDERHWHDVETIPEVVGITRTRLVEVTEQWIRDCDDPIGCPSADITKPCCGEGKWERIGEE